MGFVFYLNRFNFFLPQIRSNTPIKSTTQPNKTLHMIEFELVKAGMVNSDNAVLYYPGQKYVMFNGLQIKLDRLLEANENWAGCYLDSGMIHFMEKSDGQLIKHSACILSTTTSEISHEEDWTDYQEKKLLSMRMTQSLILIKAVKVALGTVKHIGSMLRSFDRQMEHEFPQKRFTKLGIREFLGKKKGAVSLGTIEKTLAMIEEESIDIMHEELDITPPKSKRARH